jgi:hypothetical protein
MSILVFGLSLRSPSADQWSKISGFQNPFDYLVNITFFQTRTTTKGATKNEEIHIESM